MSYETTSYADIFALTRKRRRERASPTIRHSVSQSIEYVAPRVSFPKAVIGRPSKTKFLRAQLWRMGHRTCCYCARQLRLAPFFPDTLTLEHLTPLSRGGSNHPSNLDAACSPCNNRKGSLTEAEFRAILDLERAPFR